MAVDLKRPEGIRVARKLCNSADVLIEPFRRGKNEYNSFIVNENGICCDTGTAKAFLKKRFLLYDTIN